MQKHQSEFIQAIAEQLRGIMDGNGATFDQMQRALAHACNAEGRLDPREATTAPLRVTWCADAEVDFATEEAVPASAALGVWQRSFNRGPHQPDGEQACVFDVVDVATGKSARVDLALPEYRDLFAASSECP
jgi:hypothetical protein